MARKAAERDSRAESHKPGSSEVAVLLASGLLLLPLLYVLSIGPANWLYMNADLSEPTKGAMVAFYGPINMLSDHCEPFNKVIDQYTGWWDS